MTEPLLIDGHTLTLEAVERVAGDDSPRVDIADAALERVEASRAVVDAAVSEGRVVYGITTGFGALADIVIPADRIRELQANLVRSHAAGVGEPLPEPEVRAALLLRANVLAAGCSGVRRAVIEQLVSLLNERIHPVVPERGSVGASGDLAPLAHIAHVLMGGGEAYVGGQRMAARTALEARGLDPLTLEAKEGLALINGTQVMSAIGGLALLRAERAVETAEVAGAMSLEALKGTPDPFDEAIQRVRPQAGQLTSARRLRALLADSEIRESHRVGDPRVQDAYSLRCMPQVHGAARNALGYARGILEVEINSVTDNPLVFPEDGRIMSGGNFHGQPVAQALDVAALACVEIATMSERRLARLIDPALSGLPPFLVAEAGINSGLMMTQIVAAALVADIRLRANPASTGSIPTDANREDHVSMGVGAALKLREAVGMTETVLALELLAAAQGLEFLRPMRAGLGVERARRLIRDRVAPLDGDRDLGPDIRSLEALVRGGAFAELWRVG